MAWRPVAQTPSCFELGHQVMDLMPVEDNRVDQLGRLVAVLGELHGTGQRAQLRSAWATESFDRTPLEGGAVAVIRSRRPGQSSFA